ncbi:MAG: glutaredoxin family protein [Polyangiaceae bacterium]
MSHVATNRGTTRFVALVLAMAMTAAGCKRPPAADDLGESAEQPTKALPELKISDDTADLMLTWVDGKGDAHLVNKTSDVPAEGRDRVRVVVTTKDEGTRDLFYVTNLTVKGGDGTYPVSTMSRREWDDLITGRRQALAAASASEVPGAPPDPAAGNADPSGKVHPAGFTVIVYGASWCGACHQAVAYLKRRKVPVVEKDIEQDPAADSEMRAKLARAGVHGGSIPVIDVKGKILVGFEPHSLEAAVAGASAVTL